MIREVGDYTLVVVPEKNQYRGSLLLRDHIVVGAIGTYDFCIKHLYKEMRNNNEQETTK